MIKLISDELNAALCEQIAHEQYNSNLYLVIAGFLKNRGFNNLGGKFEDQYKEEAEHGKMIYDVLTDLGSPIFIPEINEVKFSFQTIFDIADAYFKKEIETTNSLNEIKKMAIDQDCPVIEEFMRKMIKLQRHEYAEATDFMDKAILIGEDWFKVMLWDISLG